MSSENMNITGFPPAATSAAQRRVREQEAIVSFDGISKEDANKMMSEEHKRLGHRPSPDSFAAKAQSAADKAHPSQSSSTNTALPQTKTSLSELGISANEPVTQEIASKIESSEHKALGHRPPHGSLASKAQSLADKNAQDDGNRTLKDLHGVEAQLKDAEQTSGDTSSQGKALSTKAQNIVDKQLNDPVTKELAATLESLEHRSLGHRPPPGSLSAQAQSLADKNAADDGSRTLAEIQDIKSLLGGLGKSKGGSDGS